MTNLEERDALGGMDRTCHEATDQKSENYATQNSNQKAMEL